MVALLRGGVDRRGGVWADLGAGTGNFTWALAELIGTDGIIHALDRDGKAITAQQARLRSDPPPARIVPRQADVMRPLELPLLDGVLLANLLHFLRDPLELLKRLRTHLHPGGTLIIVEYEQAQPIAWVPFPMPFARFAELAPAADFAAPVQIGARRSPSSGQVLYAARAEVPIHARGTLS